MLFIYLIIGYLIAGLLFAIYFIFKGANKVDVAVEKSSWQFRFVIFPGAMLLWPILLKKIIKL